MNTADKEINIWENASRPSSPSVDRPSRPSAVSRSSQDSGFGLSRHHDEGSIADSLISNEDGISGRYKRRRRSYGDEEGEARRYPIDLESPVQKSTNASSSDNEHKTLRQNIEKDRTLNQSPSSSSEGMEIDKAASDCELTDDEETTLTKQDRSRRRRRKKSNTSLTKSIAGIDKTSRHERKLADLKVLKNSAINALLIGLWFVHCGALPN